MNNEYNEHEENLSPEEKIELENEIKRLELEIKGAQIIGMDKEGMKLPPELEGQVLDSLLAFEKMKNQAKKVKVSKILGKIEIKPAEELTEEELILAKEDLIEKLAEKGIILQSVLDVNDKDMYNFIVNQFLHEEIIHIPIKGFVRQFFYEEFNPSDELTVMQMAEGLKYLLQEGENFSIPLELVMRPEAIVNYKQFASFYPTIKVLEYQVSNIEIKKKIAKATIQLTLDAQLENSLKSHILEGECKMMLGKKDGQWKVKELSFPSIKN